MKTKLSDLSMLTPDDFKKMELIKGIMGVFNEKGINLNERYPGELQDFIDDLKNRLEIAPQSYHVCPRKEKCEYYYTAYCSHCGWFGSSKLLLGGAPIADTGDFFDCMCPVCKSTDINEI